MFYFFIFSVIQGGSFSSMTTNFFGMYLGKIFINVLLKIGTCLLMCNANMFIQLINSLGYVS